MKLVLANLDPRWSQRAHTEISSHLIELLKRIGAGGRKKHVFAWIPCFPGEADLAMFIGDALKSATVYLPRVDTSNTMSFVQIGDDWSSQLTTGGRGILQPRDGYGKLPSYDDDGLYVVVTPGLAFDKLGQRLGRGGGHYDRFFETLAPGDAIKIGVCWSMQLIQEIPVDSHDISMDWICTEKGALQTQRSA